MNQQCILCLNTCLLPVQLKCFACFDEKKMNCHSLKRVCLHCYLEMENKIQKCFFCTSPKVSKSVSVDFQVIQNDDVSLLSCPYCSLSGKTHMDLWKHVISSHVKDCECGDFFLDEKTHYQYCDKKSWCERCQQFVVNCQHKKCKFCKKKCNQTSDKCMERPFSCPECGQNFQAKGFMNHFMEHLNENRNSQKALQNSILIIKKDYKRLMNLLPSLYKEVYHENME